MEGIGVDLDTMRRVPLADDHVAAITAIAAPRNYAAGDMVAEVGDKQDRFIYVLEGDIELVDPYSGKKNGDASVGPAQFVGDIGFLNAGTYFLPMRASCPTRTIEVPREDMLALMARVPELSDHIITVYAARRQRQFRQHNSAITLIGADRDSRVQEVERFLSRNRIPFQSFDLDDPEAAQVCRLVEHEPAVIFNQDQVVSDPCPRKVAQLLNLDLDADPDTVFDILIVGAGPAGVAAAVYAGSEGLCALVVEDAAIGGQAGMSSRIENYMGFPTGISGADLVYRGEMQALKFGARFAMPRRVSGMRVDAEGRFCATLGSNETEICARSILVATGVQYRRLPLAKLEDFESAGVFYAATDMEARFCRNTEAVVIGGGNSAGQAAMHLSRSAGHVHVLVRSDSLADSMSSYLSTRLEADAKITVHYGSKVTELHGTDYLEAVSIAGPPGDQRIETRALFIMIGAAPNTDWLSDLVQLDDRGFVLTGDDAGAATPYATSCEGIFAVGDVRAGSVKRVASSVGEGSVVISAIWNWLDAQGGVTTADD